MYCYCLYCRTAAAKAVVRDAERVFGCRAIRPRQVQHTRRNRKPVDIERDLLPGYVFLYAEEKLEVSKMWLIDGVIRVLRNTDATEEHRGTYELKGADEAFALMLLERDGSIGKTEVFEEGQTIRLRETAFRGLETKILRVDRRNRRMQIEIPFANQVLQTWVEFEVVTGSILEQN